MAIKKQKQPYKVDEQKLSDFISEHNDEGDAISIPVSLFITMLKHIAITYRPMKLADTNQHLKDEFIGAIEEAFQINDEAIRHDMDDKSEILPVYEEMFRLVHEDLNNRHIISGLLTENVPENHTLPNFA